MPRIPHGCALTVRDSDGDHTFTASNGAFNAYLSAGQTFTYVFPSPGDFSFYCYYHQGTPYYMMGTIHVT